MVSKIPTVQKHKSVYCWRKLCRPLCSSACTDVAAIQQGGEAVQSERNCAWKSSTRIRY
nr:hypothetical protein Iba_chr11aCG17920 [Ipomoea batatas]